MAFDLLVGRYSANWGVKRMTDGGGYGIGQAGRALGPVVFCKSSLPCFMSCREPFFSSHVLTKDRHVLLVGRSRTGIHGRRAWNACCCWSLLGYHQGVSEAVGWKKE